MGCYGIGPGRTIAAVVEQHHDEHGIAWPATIAPYEVHVVALPGAEEIAERRRPTRSRRAGAASSSTTATSARARSSPTPT